ncbi:MAG: ROK family protein [Bacteroidota bacterium]
MQRPITLGVDIGGSHITAALVDIETSSLIVNSIQRRAVDSGALSLTILDAWCDVINAAYKGYETLTKNIGIAMPGPFDYENGICLIEEQIKFRALYGLNLKEELAMRLAIPASNINFMNDAAGFLQGEVFAGDCKNVNKAIGLTLGTGLGAAIYTNGIATDAALWNSPFLNGIAEDYLSTRWFVKRYAQLSGKVIDGVRDLAALVTDDLAAKQVFNEFGANFATFLMPLIRKHRADVVMIGGNIAQTFPVFSPYLFEVLERNQFKASIKITVLKEHAALIGAASCYQI